MNTQPNLEQKEVRVRVRVCVSVECVCVWCVECVQSVAGTRSCGVAWCRAMVASVQCRVAALAQGTQVR